MKIEQKSVSSNVPAYRTERIIASLVMAWVIILTSYMIFQDHALSEASMYFLKILLSLSGAVMLATLPGFLDINYGVGGLTVRAAGGAAAFVFIFTQSPHLPALKSTASPHPHTQSGRPGATSHKSGYDRDSMPLLFALSLDAASVASQVSAIPYDGSVTGSIDGVGPGLSAGPGWLLGSGGRGLTVRASETVSIALTAVTIAAVRLADNAMLLLQRTARAFQAAGSWIADLMHRFVDQVRSIMAAPGPQLYAFVVSAPEKTAELVNAALAPAVAAVEQLTTWLQQSLPIVGGLSETVAAVPELLGKTLDDTVSLAGQVAGDVVTGLLHAPHKAVSLTSKAVNDLTEGVTSTTKDVLAAPEELARAVDSRVSALTDTLNRVAPALVTKIDPGYADLPIATGKVFEAAGDVTSALPALPSLQTARGLGLPELPLAADRFGDSKGGGQTSEIISGCGSCLLQPIDMGKSLGSGAGGLGNTLSGLTGNGGNGQGAGAAGASSGGGVASAGDGGGAAGPGGAVSSTVSTVGSTLGRATRGLGRR